MEVQNLRKHKNITDCDQDIIINSFEFVEQINNQVRDLPGSKPLDSIVKMYKAPMIFDLCYPSMSYQTINCIGKGTNNT